MGSAVPGLFSRRTETPSATYRWGMSIFKEMVFSWSEIRFFKISIHFQLDYKHPFHIPSRLVLLILAGGWTESVCHYAKHANLGLVESFLHELHRHTSITCISFPHTCTRENATFQGYDLPQDAVIYANFYAVHMDPGIVRWWWEGGGGGGGGGGGEGKGEGQRERGGGESLFFTSHHSKFCTICISTLSNKAQHVTETHPEPEKFKMDRFVNEDGKFVKADTVFIFGAGRWGCEEGHSIPWCLRCPFTIIWHWTYD